MAAVSGRSVKTVTELVNIHIIHSMFKRESKGLYLIFTLLKLCFVFCFCFGFGWCYTVEGDLLLYVVAASVTNSVSFEK